MRYRRKKQTKKLWSVLSCEKNGMCKGKKMRIVNIHTKYTELQNTEFGSG